MIIKFSLEKILFILFSVVYLSVHILAIPALVANLLIAIAGLMCFAHAIMRGKLGYVKNRTIAIGIVCTVLMATSYLYNGNANITNLLWIWSYLGVAFLITGFDIDKKTYILAYSVVVLTFLYEMISGHNAQEALEIGSGNNISTIVLFFTVLLYLNIWSKNCKVAMPYYPVVICVILSIWGNGRAGLLSSAVFFALIFGYNFLVVRGNKVGTLIRIIAVVLIFYFVAIQYLGTYINMFLQKFDIYGTDSIRFEIWREYISGALHSPLDFLLGVKIQPYNYPVLYFYGGNTHNAFLMLHSKYGIIGFLIFTIYTLLAMTKLFRNKAYLPLITMFVVIIRSMFDWTGFPGLYDVFFWMYIIWNYYLPNEQGIIIDT